MSHQSVFASARYFLAMALAIAPATQAQEQPKKLEDLETFVKGAKEYEGLFKLYSKGENLYAEIRQEQVNKPYLCPIAIARGLGVGGHTLNFDEQWVLLFQRVGDKIHVVRRNVRFRAKTGSPEARAVETTYTDSVLLALKIHAANPLRQSVLINLNDIFMSDFAQLNLGSFDASRSSWHRIKTFSRNIEVEVSATYSGRGRQVEDSVIDSRGTTVVIHYGLCELPDSKYVPRLADDRVGYFLSVVKDFSSEAGDTSFVRYAKRWRVDRAEPEDSKRPGKLSAPKKKIVFWIERSVPVEYRAFVREGILEWNKAFEKIGFRDVIEVRQQESEDFDPEDINYNTFRWITSDQGYAMGPSRANPLTGEIFDADIVFDGSMVRFWKQQHELTTATAPASLIEAGRRGWGLTVPFAPGDTEKRAWNDKAGSADLRTLAIRNGFCQCGSHRRFELGMAAMAFAERGLLKPGEKVPEELIGQAIRETVMHEVGHTLGLRHNFKASTMLKNEDLHNTAITRKQGLVGSVMDYAPVNLAPKGVKQGDYFSTTIGPYDYWAIEYAYKPLTGGTEGEWQALQEIAAKGATPGHDYGTDEDLYGTADPLINQWDLGSDPMKFAQDRILLADELFKGLGDKVVEKGEGYQRLRQAFAILLNQYGNAAHLVANHVGGEHINRDHRGDMGDRDPFIPVKAEKQRDALRFLQQHILTDKPFQFSPQLLRRLAADRWSHWGGPDIFSSVDYPVHQRVLAIQRVVLRQLLDADTLNRIQNNALKADKGENPLTLAEVFRALTDAVWTDGAMKSGKEGKKAYDSSVILRNLQRQYVQDLTAIVLGTRSAPPDARSLARFHLRAVQTHLKKALEDKDMQLEDTVRAHLEESQERIAKVLSASVQVRE